LLAAVTVALLFLTIGAVVRNQLRVQKGRQNRVNQARIRRSLFEMLQPVALTNCQFARFGETHDGGYLMCGNLLGQVQSGYSYGISGYDKWGCDISTKLNVKLHQYDCFNPIEPMCSEGHTVFHTECVGSTAKTENNRFFDTLKNQFAKNGDTGKHVVMKMDVEGAEWDSLLYAPDELVDQIDQMAMEFHWVQAESHWIHDEKYQAVVQRLKKLFYIAHLHFNNASCIAGLNPFPSWAYEVLLVSKRLGVVDTARAAPGLHPLDAPNNPSLADCQPVTP
jgi:hypothetical protein